MKIVLYVDLLLLINFLIDYFLLLGTKLVSGASASRVRIVFAAVLASLASLVILLPPMPLMLQIAYKAVTGMLIVLAAFRYISWKHYIKDCLWFSALSFLLAGAVLLFMYTFSSPAISANNLNFYFDISPILLLLCMLVVYLGTVIVINLLGAPRKADEIKIVLHLHQSTIQLRAMYDTGFKIKDVFTGRMVVLANFDACSQQLPQKAAQAAYSYFKGRVPVKTAEFPMTFVPFKTVQGEGVFPAFAVDKAEVFINGKNKEVSDVLLALTKEPLTNGQYTALIGPELAMQFM